MGKAISFKGEGREKLKAGVDILANAVKVTLGPKGRNVVIQRPFGPAIVTKDGVTVAEHVALDDQTEQLGVELVGEVASRTAKIAGDGTTTATVLAQAIVAEGMKNIAAGANATDLKRGIDIATEEALKFIESQSEKVNGNYDRLKQIATISSNNDEKIGKLIADAVSMVTEDGIVTVQGSAGAETYLEEVSGMHFSKGFISPYFMTDEKRSIAEYENPFILIYQNRISSIQAIGGILEKVSRARRPILIITQDMDAPAIQALVLNKGQGNLDVVAVKTPGFGDNQRDILEDIALLTGGVVLGNEKGFKVDTATLDQLGTCDKIVVDANSTTILGGKGDVTEKVSLLKERIADKTTTDFVKDQLKVRLAKLTGGVAIIHVGANSEIEMAEKKYRVEDAVHATRAAIAEGVVTGGGKTLFDASHLFPMVRNFPPDIATGVLILKRALEAPMRTIAENAGFSGEVISQTVARYNHSSGAEAGFGFDANTGTFKDLKAAGVIDPAKVVRVALENASSVAGLILTTECVIAVKEEPNFFPQQQQPMFG